MKNPLPPILAAVLVCLAGCPKKQPEYNEADLNKTVVTLENPGAEPKKQLRYKFQAGREDAMSMELKMSMEAGIPGMAVGEIDIPRITMQSKINSQSINDQGHLTYDMKVTAVDVDGAGQDRGNPAGVDPDTLLRELGSIVGTGATETVTPRGFAGGARKKQSAIGNKLQKISGNSMLQPEENLWVPLPAEPVGKGARWTARRLMRENGILFTQSMTYQLVSLEGDRGTVKLSLKQEAPEQEFVSPDMPPGATAEIEKLDSRGSGQVDFDLTRPVTRMELDMSIAMVILVKAEGQRVRARPKVKITAKFLPGTAPDESVKKP